MKKKQWLAIGLVLVLVLGVLAGCGGSQEPAAGGEEGNGEGESRVLKVGLNAAFPPFEMRDENDQLIGFDVDLMKELGAIMGYEIEFIDVPWEGIFAGLGTTYDVVCSGVTIKEERKNSMEFTDPYYEAGQVIIVRQDYDEIQSEKDLPGKKLGVQVGTTAHEILLEMEGINEGDIIPYDNYPLAFIDLVNGGCDAVIVDIPVGKAEVKENDKVKMVSEEPFIAEYNAIAVTKGNTELVEELNAALAELKESGKYEELVQKWFVEFEG